MSLPSSTLPRLDFPDPVGLSENDDYDKEGNGENHENDESDDYDKEEDCDKDEGEETI